MFIRRSWSGQAFSRFDKSRICSGVTSPGSPSDMSLIGAAMGGAGTAAVVSSGAISSIVDLKRTAGGDWDSWSTGALKSAGAFWITARYSRYESLSVQMRQVGMASNV